MRDKMVSTTVYLKKEQVQTLDKLNKITKIPKAELLRLAVTDLFMKYEATLLLEPSAVPKIIDPSDNKSFIIGGDGARVA